MSAPTSAADQLAATAGRCLFPNYGNRQITMVRGAGARCWDADGKEYLDFLAGIAVNNLGHCHPKVVEAIRAQAESLIHCSNIFLIEPQIRLAERLCAESGMDRAFFSNSGTEATEGAIKLARLASRNTRGAGRDTILAFTGSFHGRTYGSMSATWSPKVRKGFGPLVPGFRFAKFNDLESVDAVWDDSICGVLVETVQGEGGIHPATEAFLEGLRERCTRSGALLIIDEIQCGMGRCGRAFAFQHTDVKPDVLLAAKALGGGLPLGAFLSREDIAAHLQPGTHGSTFGGNPVACAAGVASCEVLFDRAFLEGVGRKGCKFWGALGELKTEFPDLITTIRGLGLMIGVELTRPGADLVLLGRERGLLFNCTADTVLRFLPPLVIEDADIDLARAILRECLTEFRKTSPPA